MVVVHAVYGNCIRFTAHHNIVLLQRLGALKVWGYELIGQAGTQTESIWTLKAWLRICTGHLLVDVFDMDCVSITEGPLKTLYHLPAERM